MSISEKKHFSFYLFDDFSGNDTITGMPVLHIWGSSDCFSAKASCIAEKSTFGSCCGGSVCTICKAVFLICCKNKKITSQKDYLSNIGNKLQNWQSKT